MNRPLWVYEYRGSLVAGVVAVALLTSSLMAQSTVPPMVEQNIVTILSALGVLVVGLWRIGRLEKDFARFIEEREKLKAEYLRLDRFEDHRLMMRGQHQELMERLEKLHESIRDIRKFQLHRTKIGDRVEEDGP